MIKFCESMNGCLRKRLLKYLDEEYDEKECKERCGNCKNKIRTIEEDMTECARIVIQMANLRN